MIAIRSFICLNHLHARPESSYSFVNDPTKYLIRRGVDGRGYIYIFFQLICTFSLFRRPSPTCPADGKPLSREKVRQNMKLLSIEKINKSLFTHHHLILLKGNLIRILLKLLGYPLKLIQEWKFGRTRNAACFHSFLDSLPNFHEYGKTVFLLLLSKNNLRANEENNPKERVPL